MSKRFLSGIQPSGELHLGNYFGAIRKHIENQDNAFYFIADYHALTTLKDADALRRNVFDVAATYLAFGLDPEKAVLFRQSDVPEVTELTWLLMTVTGMGLLERATSFKDKKAKGIQASLGLFNYPALMAADILAYDSEVVPVGSDQVQHLEMTRAMAGHFNALYGEVFKLPEYILGTPVPVPGIDGDKMSKSYGNTVPIFLRGKKLRKRLLSITTDSTPLEDPKDPDTCTVFALYKLMGSAEQTQALREKYEAGNFGYGHAKVALYELMTEAFGEAADRYEHLQANPEIVEAALLRGAERARPLARATLNRARKACGLD